MTIDVLTEILEDLALKSTLLLALILPLVLLLRKRSATLRHRFLSLAMWGLLLLPAAASLLPNWYLDLPAIRETPSTTTPVKAEPRLTKAETPKLEKRVRDDSVAAETPIVARQPLPIALWICLAWLAGALAVTIRFQSGRFRAACLVRTGIPLEEPVWLEQLTAVRTERGIRRSVALMEAEVSGPVLVGIRRPAVLVPFAARRWPEARVRAVLLHELAHLQRNDLLHQFIAQLCCALYWYNPLVWLAARRLVVDREIASDDFVLNSGLKASDYAAHLLAAAGHSLHRNSYPMEVVAMAKGHSLKGRLITILDPKAKRTPPRGSALALILLMTGLMVPVAAFAPFDKPPPKAPVAPEPALAASSVTAPAAPEPALAASSVTVPAAPEPMLAASSVTVPAAPAPEPVIGPVPAAVPMPEAAPEPALAVPTPGASIEPVRVPGMMFYPEPASPPSPAAAPAPVTPPSPSAVRLYRHDEHDEEEAQEEAEEQFEEAMEDMMEDFEERLEDLIENLEDTMEDWAEDLEDRMEDRVSEKKLEAFEEEVEAFEEKVDELDDRFDDQIDALEDSYDFEDLPPNPDAYLAGLRKELNTLAKNLEREIAGLEKEFEKLRKRYD
ncbi:MAG: M56 family metallopeptidase [Acidobacteriota bacterium]|nr:M56 family metallopeptidase [Acidobacteriota bacterium]